MVTPNVTLIGAVDDTRGLGVSVYQDHDGVRIDVGQIEIMLTIGQLSKLRGLLASADAEAILWDVMNGVDL